ncbi:hypothetical protein Tco_0622212, partial [Tanacetum coccineum]
QSAGPADQAVDQPSLSEPLPFTSHPSVISEPIPVFEPTHVDEPTPHPKSFSPKPDNKPIEHTFEQPLLEHQPLSPRQETEVPQSQDPTHPHVPEARTITVDDLFHLVPKLITKVDSLETELKQTKLTMGKAIVKLVKKVKKMEDILKRRHVVLTELEDEEPEDQRRIIQYIGDDPLVSSVRESMKEKSTDFVTPTKPSREAQEEDISPTTLEVAKTLSKVASQRSKSVDKVLALKKLKFEDIKEEFDKLVKQIDTFVPVNIEATKAQLKRYGEELQTEISKKQRIGDTDASVIEEEVAKVKEEEPAKRIGKRRKQKARKGISNDKSPQEDSESDKEESIEAMNPTPLDTKSNIVANWKIFQQGERSIYQIIRANGADTVYMSFGAMLKDFIREDLIELYRLIMKKYGTNMPEDAYDRVLWSDLRTMLDPPLNEDAI